MNNFMKMMLIVFIIIILGTLTVLLTGVVSSEQSQVTREKTIEGTSFNELFIQTGSADIMLSATNNTTGIRVVLTETKYNKSKSDIQLNVQPEGERLTLSESHGNGFWNIGRHIEMKVEVPRKEFGQIQMRTGSGNI